MVSLDNFNATNNNDCIAAGKYVERDEHFVGKPRPQFTIAAHVQELPLHSVRIRDTPTSRRVLTFCSKIKLDSANVVFTALESSPDTLLECLIRRLPHEPKTVIIAYEKAIGRASKSDKLKTLNLLKLASEKVKRVLGNSTLDISILTSGNGNVGVTAEVTRLLTFCCRLMPSRSMLLKCSALRPTSSNVPSQIFTILMTG